MCQLRQPLPWPGKLRARREVAEREPATSRDQIVEAAAPTRRRGEVAFIDLALAERSLAINDRQRTLLEAMVQSAESRIASVGAASAILKTQEELLTVENERLDLDRARDEARARLNALLNRDPHAPLPAVAMPCRPCDFPTETELLQHRAGDSPGVKLR